LSHAIVQMDDVTQKNAARAEHAAATAPSAFQIEPGRRVAAPTGAAVKT
jgi:methyl-accepting chemotaxis protein